MNGNAGSCFCALAQHGAFKIVPAFPFKNKIGENKNKIETQKEFAAIMMHLV